MGAGSGVGEDVEGGEGVGSATGDADSEDGEGSCLGEVVGEGLGGFVGFGGLEGFGELSAGTCMMVPSTVGAVLAAIAEDPALTVKAIVKSAMALACTTRLLRRPLELPAT